MKGVVSNCMIGKSYMHKHLHSSNLKRKNILSGFELPVQASCMVALLPLLVETWQVAYLGRGI